MNENRFDNPNTTYGENPPTTTQADRETLQFHWIGSDPRPRGLYPDDPVMIAWQARQSQSSKIERAA